MKLNLLLLIILFSLVSCSSNRKNANKYMQAGLYEKALPLWVKIVNDDPDDANAKIALNKCQDQILQKHFLKIRDLRVAGDMYGALESGLKIKLLTSKWKLNTNINGSSFERSEIGKIYVPFLNDQILHTKKGHYLKTSYNLSRYGRLFDFIDKGKMTEINVSAQKKGKKKCRKMRKRISKKPYLSSFVDQYCTYYKINSSETVDSKRQIKLLTKILFSRVTFNSNLKSMQENQKELFEKAAETAFKKSAWHHPQAEAILSFKLKGDYSYDYMQTRIKKTHSYTVRIPYFVEKKVKKNISTPYVMVTQQCSAAGVCVDKKVTKYRNKVITKVIKEEKFRDDPRLYNYVAIIHKQQLACFVKARVKINNITIDSSVNEDQEYIKEGHDKDLPDINLYPQVAMLIKPLNWLKAKSVLFEKKISQSLKKHWEDKYCQAGNVNKVNMYTIGETVMKCKRSDSSATFVDSWHKKYFKLSLLEIESLIGKY